MTNEEATEKMMEEDFDRFDSELNRSFMKKARDHEMTVKALNEEEFEDIRNVLNQLKSEIDKRTPKNYMGEFELGGNSCVFSRNQLHKLIDEIYVKSSEVDR